MATATAANFENRTVWTGDNLDNPSGHQLRVRGPDLPGPAGATQTGTIQRRSGPRRPGRRSRTTWTLDGCRRSMARGDRRLPRRAPDLRPHWLRMARSGRGAKVTETSKGPRGYLRTRTDIEAAEPCQSYGRCSHYLPHFSPFASHTTASRAKRNSKCTTGKTE